MNGMWVALLSVTLVSLLGSSLGWDTGEQVLSLLGVLIVVVGMVLAELEKIRRRLDS